MLSYCRLNRGEWTSIKRLMLHKSGDETKKSQQNRIQILWNILLISPSTIKRRNKASKYFSDFFTSRSPVAIMKSSNWNKPFVISYILEPVTYLPVTTGHLIITTYNIPLSRFILMLLPTSMSNILLSRGYDLLTRIYDLRILYHTTCVSPIPNHVLYGIGFP